MTCVAGLYPGPAPPGLEREWRALEPDCAGSVFLSWPWIAATGIGQGPDCVLVRVTDDGRTIALGFLGLGPRRLLGLRPPALHLNESGAPVRDRIMTEYNGLLAVAGREDDAVRALLAALGSDKTLRQRDLLLSGVDDHWAAACRDHGLSIRLLRPVQVAPFAALQIRPEHDLLAAMTRNSRQQIRRSFRYYESQTPLVVERAGDVPQALAWLERLEELHTRAWNRRGKVGAFADTAFMDFHRRLITDGFSQGVTDLLRVRSGDTIIGYLYNLRWRHVVYAYQSGFHFHDQAQARPGLVAHVLAMRLYRGEDMATYRFLAGEARYKTSLASGLDELTWMLAYRPSPGRWLESMADRLLTACSVIARKIEVKACNSKKPS